MHRFADSLVTIAQSRLAAMNRSARFPASQCAACSERPPQPDMPAARRFNGFAMSRTAFTVLPILPAAQAQL